MTMSVGKAASGALATLLTVAMLAAVGCNRGSSGGEGSSAVAPVPTLLVTAARAEIVPMRKVVTVMGTTVALSPISIRSPANGRVVGIHIQNGDYVRKGQVIAHVVNREIEAARAGLEVAKRLDTKDAAALAKSVARYDRGPGIPIVAPESGVVAKPPVVSGQIVSNLDTIAELIDPASIYVNAAVPIGVVHLLRPGMPATVSSPLWPGAEFPARVAAIFPVFDPASATAPVRIDFAGDQAIHETAAPVVVRITVAEVPGAIVIPESALFQDAGANRYHVFVAGADGRAHRVEVAIGIRQNGRVQVTIGIKPGEQVITSGGYALSDGLRVKVGGA